LQLKLAHQKNYLWQKNYQLNLFHSTQHDAKASIKHLNFLMMIPKNKTNHESALAQRQ
jgi:hypothetical protein